jgi:hypothetical protein
LVKDNTDTYTAMPVYRVDTKVLAELREHETQAAEELGQWSEER